MEQNRELTINIGLPSILLIFVSLCLISFAVLTLVTSNSDLKLSQKIGDRTLTYYNACNQAEEAIATYNSQLLAIYNSCPNENEFYQNSSDITLSFPIENLQTLLISIQPHFPNEENQSLYSITSWKIATNNDINYEDSLNVIVDF